MSSPSLNRAKPVLPVSSTEFASTGPVVTVYLTTSGALPDAADQAAVRWKNLRRQLLDDGAPEGALDAVESLLDGAHAVGETLMVIADESGVLYSAHLPESPDDVATYGALPHLAPLLEAVQRMLPHVVVVTDRVGGEIVAVLPDARDRHREVDGEAHHASRSAPGGWSQRRFQQRAENQWEANAREVAAEVVRMADDTRPRLVVVSGDVRAVAFLRDHLPDRVTDILAEVQGDYGSPDEAVTRAASLVADLADDDVREVLAVIAEQHEAAHVVRGVEATLEALARGQAETIVVDPTRLDGQSGFFGPDLAQVAGSAEELRIAGVEEPKSAPLIDVLIRAAIGTAADVVIATDADELSSGAAALLRY